MYQWGGFIFSFNFLNFFFFFIKSCICFLYPTHFMFGIIFWSSFCFFYFILYFSIKNSTQLRESVCFFMGQVNISGIIDWFFTKMQLFSFKKNENIKKLYSAFVFKYYIFRYLKWKLNTNTKSNKFLSDGSYENLKMNT